MTLYVRHKKDTDAKSRISILWEKARVGWFERIALKHMWNMWNQILRYSTKAQTRLGLCFVPFPGPRSSGDQVLGECTVSGGPCILITSLVPAAQFPRCATIALPQVSHVSPLGSWSQAATLLADVNHPGSQEDFISNWEPARSLVKGAVSGAEFALCLPALAVSRLPFCLQHGDGPVHSPLALLWYWHNPLFCELTSLCLGLELFVGKFSLSLSLSFSLSLWLSHSLGCYLMLAPSDCPQGIHAQSLP